MGNPTSRYGRLSVLVGDGVITGEVYWSAVFAGVIVTLVGQVLWALLGTGIGAGMEPAANGEVGWGAYAYWSVTGIASAAAGGWTAGWIAGSAPRTDRIEGSFQGFLSWAIATLILTVVILGMAGGALAIARSIGGPLASAPPDAAVHASTAALWGFFALVAGALASMGAAYLGVGQSNVPAATTTRKGAAARATA